MDKQSLAPETTSTPPVGAPTAIDVEKLAEKVYQLLRADIRLAQARGDRRTTRK